MKQDQHALLLMNEELAEVAIELLQLQNTVSKAIRFGVEDQHEDRKSNIERINQEWCDLLVTISHLRVHGVHLEPNAEAIAAKAVKIAKYTKYSQECSQVDPDVQLAQKIRHLIVDSAVRRNELSWQVTKLASAEGTINNILKLCNEHGKK